MSTLSLVIALAALVVGLALGRMLGSRAERQRVAERLSGFARWLGSPPGELPPPPDSEELRGIAASLESGWVRKGSEREEAVQAALERVSAFLKVAIEGPLNRALSADASCREAVEDALGAVEDLEFFLEDPPEGSRSTELRAVSRDVIREFVQSWGITVKELFPDRPVHVRINPDAYMDALFLILHNAAHFSDGERITVQVEQVGHEAEVSVRDRGPGFSTEALMRATDPFYSTSEGGLGLGLPQARRLIEGQGGTLRLRNPDEGGAEVTVAFPLD